jgi:hypothetical protein
MTNEEIRFRAINLSFQFYEGDAETPEDIIKVAKVFEQYIVKGETTND